VHTQLVTSDILVVSDETVDPVSTEVEPTVPVPTVPDVPEPKRKQSSLNFTRLIHIKVIID
jgi:hypothetical protein